MIYAAILVKFAAGMAALCLLLGAALFIKVLSEEE